MIWPSGVVDKAPAPGWLSDGNVVFHAYAAKGDSKTEARLETVWDWVTVFGFAGLVTLLLQRSSEAEPRDELWQYAPPAVGFAVANYLGNEGQPWIAGALLIAVVAYIFKVLKVTLPGR